ncbi:uncharacterized protein LOC62_06G007871 [Vanrija pseudolonga]|uniref:Uncharacterized protein n=1 Tax=Vanrija pseudolonga TaxID=143232 RepID=A0AAF0YGD8_9TREE|nr:hypothetical protein LOC62_06G007871 [Vanrija pseudolonga]
MPSTPKDRWSEDPKPEARPQTQKPLATQFDWDLIINCLYGKLIGAGDVRELPHVPLSISEQYRRHPHFVGPSRETNAEWTWTGPTVVQDAAGMLCFNIAPPFNAESDGARGSKTRFGYTVNSNLSNATAIVLDSGKCFEKFRDTCDYCATVGNEHCFFARGNSHLGCLLCVADGVSCSHKTNLSKAAPASMKRREAVLKLVGAVGDHEWAAKVFKEYEAAEEEL